MNRPDGCVRAGVSAVESILSEVEEQLDQLPFGVIELNAEGVILAYNRTEESLAGRSRSEVLNRNFFTEVAPCTNVKEFAGRYGEMVAHGGASESSLEFVFRFVEGLNWSGSSSSTARSASGAWCWSRHGGIPGPREAPEGEERIVQ